MPIGNGRWRERVVRIGAPVPLQGVRTDPEVNAAPDVAFVILNSGLLHHVGSCCFSVQLARAAAARGLVAIRYDASGVGDSAPRASSLPQDRRAVAELREVIDAVAREGVRRVVLLGLCSGAFTAFDEALDDERVHGIVQIAPFTYRTHEWYVRHYGSRVVALEAWRNFIKRKVGASSPRARGLDAKYLESYDAGWDVPSQEYVESGYGRLLARGTHLFNLMTGGEADSYLYEGQFRDMFPSLDFGERFTEWFLPDATHTITDPTHQRLVLERVMPWLVAVAVPGSPTVRSPA